MTWGAIGAAVVGGVAANRASNRVGDAGAAAQAGAAFNPFDIQSGLGTTRFQGAQGFAQLDPRFQEPSARLGAFGLQQLKQLQGGQTPTQIASGQFQRMEDLLNPVRNRQREQLESRLLRQGRLGSNFQGGGTPELREFETAIEQQRSQNLIGALGQGQQFQQGLFQNALQGIQGTVGLEQLPLQQFNLGSGLGGQAAQAGSQQGAFGIQAAQQAGIPQLAFAQGIGGALQNVNFSNLFGGGGAQQPTGAQDFTQSAFSGAGDPFANLFPQGGLQ
jgi:hypothetical protein